VRFTGTKLHEDQELFDRLIADFVHRARQDQIPIRQFSVARLEVSPGVPGTIVRYSNKAPPPESHWTREQTRDVPGSDSLKPTEGKETN
jgi:hypothetical protein